MKSELENKYSKLIEHIQVTGIESSEIKFYHTISLTNFINSFDELTTVNYKKAVSRLLNEYIDFVMENKINSASEAQELYYQYIAPVGKIYSNNIGFSFYVRFSAILVWVGFAYIFFFSLKLNILYYIITLSLAVVSYIPLYMKYKKKKVYGPRF